MKKLLVGATVVGVIAIVFGAVWITVIFPRLERIPANFTRTDDFTGSYTVVDPQVQQIQSNPTIQRVMASAAIKQALADPAVQQLLKNPTILQQLASNPLLQQLLSNPAALQQVDAATRQLLSNPAVQRLLGDPLIQQLLKDPAAVQLLGNPLALSLLADPTAPPVVKVPVKLHRVRQATGAEGDKLTLTEQVTTTRADTGQELAGFPTTNVKLVIDRRDSQYLQGTDGGRTGYLSLPFNVDKNKTYPVYISAARGPLDAKYVSMEDVQGLETIKFKVDVKDRPLGTHPDLKLPMVVDSQVTLWAEPHSGRVVNIEDHATTVSVVHPTRGKLPVYISDIKLTDASVSAQITEGKSDRTMLLWLGTYMPWTVAGVGIVLAAGGGAALAKRSARAKVAQPQETAVSK